MLLLPPSEGKAPGGDRRRASWAPTAGTFGASLAQQRADVVDALHVARGGDERLLGVRGAHLDRSRAANVGLVGALTLPAWRRYTGVVWDHLDPATLPPSARRRIVVVSALLGLVRGDDPVPDYRLKMSANLPPMGTLARWWRPTLSAALLAASRRRFVIDLLPQEHRAAIDFARVRSVSITLVDPSGKPGGHAAKAAKGVLARAILLDGLGAIDTWHHPQFELVVTPGVRPHPLRT
jgi:hypothetical protein